MNKGSEVDISVAFDTARLKFYTENSPLAVIEWDSDFIVTLWTGGAEKMFGWKSDEVIGKPILNLNLIYEPDLPLVEVTMYKLITEKSNFLESRNRNIRKDGKIIHCIWYNTILHDEKGNMKFILSQVLDITAATEYETSLIRLNAEKDRFIRILSHDLRSPFNALVTLSSLLKDNYRNFSPEDVGEQLNYIHESALQTFNFLEELLTWAKLQVKVQSFTQNKLNLSGICNDIIKIHSRNAVLKNIRLISGIETTTEVFADEYMLKTIIRNLISNAIKFSNPGGEVLISSTQNDSFVTISVSDNGTGIKAGDIPGIFDPSTVFTTKGTSGEEGTGLGLMLCKEFVEKHGGTIWVESEYGRGARFSFTMPAASQKE